MRSSHSIQSTSTRSPQQQKHTPRSSSSSKKKKYFYDIKQYDISAFKLKTRELEDEFTSFQPEESMNKAYIDAVRDIIEKTYINGVGKHMDRKEHPYKTYIVEQKFNQDIIFRICLLHLIGTDVCTQIGIYRPLHAKKYSKKTRDARNSLQRKIENYAKNILRCNYLVVCPFKSMGKKLLDSGFKVATNKEIPPFYYLETYLQNEEYVNIAEKNDIDDENTPLPETFLLNKEDNNILKDILFYKKNKSWKKHIFSDLCFTSKGSLLCKKISSRRSSSQYKTTSSRRNSSRSSRRSSQRVRSYQSTNAPRTRRLYKS